MSSPSQSQSMWPSRRDYPTSKPSISTTSPSTAIDAHQESLEQRKTQASRNTLIKLRSDRAFVEKSRQRERKAAANVAAFDEAMQILAMTKNFSPSMAIATGWAAGIGRERDGAEGGGSDKKDDAAASNEMGKRILEALQSKKELNLAAAVENGEATTTSTTAIPEEDEDAALSGNNNGSGEKRNVSFAEAPSPILSRWKVIVQTHRKASAEGLGGLGGLLSGDDPAAPRLAPEEVKARHRVAILDAWSARAKAQAAQFKVMHSARAGPPSIKPRHSMQSNGSGGKDNNNINNNINNSLMNKTPSKAVSSSLPALANMPTSPKPTAMSHHPVTSVVAPHSLPRSLPVPVPIAPTMMTTPPPSSIHRTNTLSPTANGSSSSLSKAGALKRWQSVGEMVAGAQFWGGDKASSAPGTESERGGSVVLAERSVTTTERSAPPPPPLSSSSSSTRRHQSQRTLPTVSPNEIVPTTLPVRWLERRRSSERAARQLKESLISLRARLTK